MRMAEGRRVLARRNEPGEMCHVDHEDRSDFVADLAEAREIEVPRVGRSAGDDQLGLMLLREPLDVVEVDEMIVLADAILDGVEPFARLRRRGAVRQVATRG